MRKLLNTLFVTTPEAYLSLNGENVVVSKENERLGRVPLHNIEGIYAFGSVGASPALMGECASRGIAITFLSRSGRFSARVVGQSRGNVVLRKTQYRVSDDLEASAVIARNFIVGKIFNARAYLKRMQRDHSLRIDVERFDLTIQALTNLMKKARLARDLDILRGVEGQAASLYYDVLDQCILQQKEDFYFDGRNKRPPLDRVNALLSFAYTLLAGDTAAALEAVGLDAYVGFLHRDRPGRASLALDLMEELRCVCADRFVIYLINKRVVEKDDFFVKENGAVLLTDEGRKRFISQWQERKQEKLVHPYLSERIVWGLIPYVQALLLARYLRGDLDEYPPFLWR